jgi:predicted Zn-dependent peptidase
MNASLRQEDMDVERSVILDERARELSDPGENVLQHFDALAFPDHPYGRPLLGSVPNISHITRDMLLQFYHTYYVPGNSTLVISGNVSPEDGLHMAANAFGAWGARDFPPDKQIPEAPQTEPKTFFYQGDTSEGFMTLGFHAPAVSDQPDAWVMDVLLTYLGQGGNNRLQRDLLRHSKIVTSIGADYLTQQDPGALTVSASFQAGNGDEVRDAILGEVKALRENPLSPDDLAAAKNALMASYLFDAQTTNGRADALGFYNTINTYEYDTEYLQHVQAVTSAQVQDVARRYLDPNAYTLVEMLPHVDPIEAMAR